MHLVSLTVPSTKCPTSLSAMQHPIMIFRGLEDASLSDSGTPAWILFFSRKATHIHVGLVANRHCCWAGSNLALLPSLRQEFKRFQFAVGQRYAAVCTVLAMFMLLYRLMWNYVISLKTLIFKAKISATHVALNIRPINSVCTMPNFDTTFVID